MTPVRALSVGHRLAALRSDLTDQALEGFVVTHLPNLQYLTGFSGTAGAAVISESRCVLVIDFRYETAARALVSAFPDNLIEIRVVERTYDDALTGLLVETPLGKVGVEGSSMTVGRFNRLSDALTRAVKGRDTATTLVPTERIVERRRAVKDPFEIDTLREAARLLSHVARHVPSMVREGRTELEIAAEIDTAI